jgi:hypothetical protein
VSQLSEQHELDFSSLSGCFGSKMIAASDCLRPFYKNKKIITFGNNLMDEGFTVKPDVRFRGILQHCWEYCNFDCEIALSKLQLT